MKITKKIGLLLISIMVFTSAVVVWGYGTAKKPVKILSESGNRYIQYYSIQTNNSWQTLTKNENYHVQRINLYDEFVVECQKNELTDLPTYYRDIYIYQNKVYPLTKEVKIIGTGSNTAPFTNVALSCYKQTLQFRVEPRLYSSYLNEGCWSPNMYK